MRLKRAGFSMLELLVVLVITGVVTGLSMSRFSAYLAHERIAKAAIGIADLSRPDYGEAVTVRDDEVPVFWACGVTPQAALLAARLPFAITHAPGHMLVTDLPCSGPFPGDDA